MCCECCGVTQRKVWVFGLGTLFAVAGTVLLVVWSDISRNIMYKNLVLRKGSEGYNSWVEAPIPIYLEFHLFNWTNPEDFYNPNVKPNFVEMGPYVFLERHSKENLTFYPNETISYYERRTWFFDASRSNGTLDDMVTAAHVITATVVDTIRNNNKLIKDIVNLMLNHEGGKLFVTKSAREWIFDGYQDDLIDFLKLFNTTKIHMPYKRFGWLVDRNASLEYDGLFTVHSGVDDVSKLGRLTHWNGRNETGFYNSPCSAVNGTTGDLFPPQLDDKQEITIFATDACRYLNLAPNGKLTHRGLEAIKFMGTIETLDSGENYPSQQCFCNPKAGECPKTGVVDCKKCRDNAPIYASFPHFFLGDPSYVNAVSGLSPNEREHSFMLAVEPTTGIPLSVKARLQINLLIQPDSYIDIYRGVPKVLMPMFWFEQKADLDEKLASRTKLVINLEDYGRYAGIALITLGCVFYLVGVILTLTKKWKREPREDENLLTN